MTYKIALVACSAAKLDHAARASDLYTSPLFKKAAAYAQATCDEWFILSAEHGLVHPDIILDPYDTLLTADTAKAWGKQVREQLETELNRGGPVEIVVLAGKRYRSCLESPTPWPVRVPMEGLGIGSQLGWLTKQLDDIGAEPAVTDEQLHTLSTDEKASMLFYLRGWMSRPGADFNEGMRYAYRDQLESRARLEAYRQRQLDEHAEAIARVTGSRGSTYTEIRPDGSSASGSWGRL